MQDKIDAIAAQYVAAKEQIKALESELKAIMPAAEGQLVVEKSTGKNYRARHVWVDDKGLPYLSVKEIKNDRVNWESISIPRLYYGEFDVVEWHFDRKEEKRLRGIIENTDSIAETSDAKRQLTKLYRSCLHNWTLYRHTNGYICSECGCCTAYDAKTDSHDIEIPV